MASADEAGALPAELDTLTTLRLGQALYRFLARLGEESDMDCFRWEDAGVSLESGFIEIDLETCSTVLDLIDKHHPHALASP